VFVLAVIAVSLLFAGRESLLRAGGSLLVVSDPVASADAIAVLAGSIPDRILHAVDLYRAGMAPRIFLTRGRESGGRRELRARGIDIPEPYQLNRKIALRLGVPPEAVVVVEERAASTREEIGVLLAALRRQRARSVLLVTSKTHSRRAALIFHVLSGDEIRAYVSPTPYDPFTPGDWWHHRAIARRVVTEYAKWIFFELVDRWRAGPQLAAGVSS